MMPLPREAEFQGVNAGGVPAEWTSMGTVRQNRVVLYFHGSGFIMGSVKTHRALTAHISRAAGVRVLSVDYRLAPEHPFPAAVEDGTAAYRWLLGNGFAPERIAVAGDSAGGALAVATMLDLKESGAKLPAAGVFMSPVFDCALTGESMETKASADPMLQRDDLAFMFAHYLGPTDPRTPTASPLYGNLEGLPPILIQVGSDEVLLDDSRRFAQRAKEMGVPIELDIWEGMTHVWQMGVGFVPEAQKAVKEIGSFLKSKWGQTES
jgi:acetyl esterase/lipase